MKRPLDDALITAYAFGELPEPERSAVADEISRSPELQAEVLRIQQMATTLEQALAQETSPVPTTLEKQRLLPPVPNKSERFWSLWLQPFRQKNPLWKLSWAMGLVVAFCAAAFLSFNFLNRNKPDQKTDVQVSVNPAPLPEVAQAPTRDIPVLPMVKPPSEIVSSQVAAKAVQPIVEVPPPVTITNNITYTMNVVPPPLARTITITQVANATPPPVEKQPPVLVAVQTLSNQPTKDLGSYVALKIKLPNPTLKGTPEDLPSGPNIEPLSDKARPPFMAPPDVRNVALNKPVIASCGLITGKLEQITDGEKEAADDQVVEMRKGLQYVQIDLQDSFKIFAIVLWNDHRYIHTYNCLIIQISDDPNFQQNVRTLYNNDFENKAGLGIGKDRQYFETREGRLIDARGESARFIRWYTRGSNLTALNNRTEIEVYALAGN